MLGCGHLLDVLTLHSQGALALLQRRLEGLSVLVKLLRSPLKGLGLLRELRPLLIRHELSKHCSLALRYRQGPLRVDV